MSGPERASYKRYGDHIKTGLIPTMRSTILGDSWGYPSYPVLPHAAFEIWAVPERDCVQAECRLSDWDQNRQHTKSNIRRIHC